MHLRRLEVHGFKAFADRQRFDYGPGMTVVVGPNGSGKSNVADAIRWVLGETSVRAVRARKTEEVIFSGSDKRRQMGAAEVSITLDNSEQWMPVDYNEVTVTRRAFRSGENEYLINGQKVRLQDVLDLFRRAQVGQNSYAMMSQGLVDEVLAMRPSERRELIEEAANVRRHRQQLVLTERRLVETRDNLGRVRMLLREVEPRVRQLERQSQRAQRYRELAAELHELQQVYYEEEIRAANEALAAARARHDQQSTEFQEAQTAAQAVDARLTALGTLVAQRREALDALQRRERELAEQELGLAQQIALNEQRTELLASRRAEIEAELATLELPEEPATDDDAAGLGPLELAVTQARTSLEREREALRSADEEARAVLRDLAAAETRRARLGAEHADVLRRIEELGRRRTRLEAERRDALERRTALLERLRGLRDRARTLRREAAALAGAADDARRQRETAEQGLEEQLRAIIEARDAVRVAESHVRQHRERLELLRQIAESLAANDSASRAILQAATPRSNLAPGDEPPLGGIVGELSRLIRVPEELEVAIEAALADQLSAVVVEREADAAEAIAFLQEQEAGVASVFPLDAVRHDYPINLFNERGVIGVAARLVRCEQRYRPLVDTLLGRVIVVQDLKTAQQMVRRGLGSVVTRDGVLLRPTGEYRGGRSGEQARRFSLQRELDELPAQIEQAERVAGAARARLGQLEDTVLAARAAVDQARGSVDQTEERRREHARIAAALRRDVAALSGEKALVRRALGVTGDDTTAEAEATSLRQSLEAELESVGEALEALRDRSEVVGTERDAVAERVTAAAGALAAAEGAHRAALEQRAERAEARRRAHELLEQRRQQLQSVQRDLEDLALSLRTLREQAANARSALGLAQAAVGPAHASFAEAAAEERELQAQRGDSHARLFAAERAVLESEGELRQSAARLQRLREQLADDGLSIDEHGVVRPLEPLEPEAAEQAALFPAAGGGAGASVATQASQALSLPEPLRGGADVDPTTLRERISELRAQIRSLGPVNIDAVEELSEERERFEFLSTQVTDLEAAEQELREAIAEARMLIRTRFDETFTQVNSAFADYFTRFFGGGQAALHLVEGAEGDDPGVEVSAQPPGKRIASLNVLSGGERSLTSVALLFALLSVNPAPICVLDEVDAALDEANVGRFVDTLREMTERSQFIVISHNRRTIEAADAIYGVTMGDDSASQVLSLRLADLPAAS